MKYEPIQPINLSEARVCIESGDPTLIADGLLRASLSGIDHRWVENACLDALDRPELGVRWAALLALGHLARRWNHINVGAVMRAVEPFRTDSELSGRVDDLLDDITVFVRDEDTGDEKTCEVGM